MLGDLIVVIALSIYSLEQSILSKSAVCKLSSFSLFEKAVFYKKIFRDLYHVGMQNSLYFDIVLVCVHSLILQNMWLW